MPKRVQRKRTKGWRMPENCVSVTRPGRWGNPFRVGVISEFGDVPDSETAVAFYRAWIDKGLQRERIVRELRGKNLACYCSLCDEHKDGLPMGVACPDCKPCHADVLLLIANR